MRVVDLLVFCFKPLFHFAELPLPVETLDEVFFFFIVPAVEEGALKISLLLIWKCVADTFDFVVSEVVIASFDQPGADLFHDD